MIRVNWHRDWRGVQVGPNFIDFVQRPHEKQSSLSRMRTAGFWAWPLLGDWILSVGSTRSLLVGVAG